jgi:hypothetical protein
MNTEATEALISTVELIAATLDVAPDSWTDHLQAVRNVTGSLDLSDTVPDGVRRHWQVPLITVFQRVAFGDPDNGGVLDVSNCKRPLHPSSACLLNRSAGCLRQALTLLQLYPENIDLLTRELIPSQIEHFADQIVIGQNWLLRAQKPLARIHHAEQSSMSSGSAESQDPPLSSNEEQRRVIRATIEAEDRLHSAEYVEARGLLLPAIDYLKHAVEVAGSQDKLSGKLLSMVCSALSGYLSSLSHLTRLQKRA